MLVTSQLTISTDNGVEFILEEFHLTHGLVSWVMLLDKKELSKELLMLLDLNSLKDQLRELLKLQDLLRESLKFNDQSRESLKLQDKFSFKKE